MIEINGGVWLCRSRLRFMINVAKDADDAMFGAIPEWFESHTATDADSFHTTSTEFDEEMNMIKALLAQYRKDEASQLLDNWMVFDDHPYGRDAWLESMR